MYQLGSKFKTVSSYQRKFPKCPYRVKGARGCSNKQNKGICPYKDPQKPERCRLYNEWLKLTKSSGGLLK